MTLILCYTPLKSGSVQGQPWAQARFGADGGVVNTRANLGVSVAALLVVLAAAGCASVPPPPLPSDDVRNAIGTLGVVAFRSGDTVGPESPTKGAGEGAAVGARQGAQEAYSRVAEASCGANEPSGVLCAVGIGVGAVLAPIGAIVGAGIGVGRSRSQEQVEAAQASLIAVLDATRPDIELRDQVVRYARRHVAVEALADAAGSAASQAGVNTVLELQPIHLGVVTEGKISPVLKVTLDVRGTLVSATSGRGLYIRSWVYRGSERDYFELGADGGAAFRAELDRAYDRLAKKIVRDLLVATDPAPEEREEDGTAWAVEATELVGWRARMARSGTCFGGQKLTMVRLDGESLLEEFTRRPLDRGDITFYPGRHEIALACAAREQMGAFVRRGCGRLAFVAEPGVFYRPDWTAPNRLSLIEGHTGRAVGTTETWSERAGFFDLDPCEK